MKAVQITRTALKSTVSPLPFLIPTFAASTAATPAQNVIRLSHTCPKTLCSRSFSTTSLYRTPEATSRAEQGQGSEETSDKDRSGSEPAGMRKSSPHSRQDIANQLGSILPPQTARFRRRPQAGGALQFAQGHIADSMGLFDGIQSGSGLNSTTSRFGSVPKPPLPLRLDPYVGRGEQLTRGRSLASALRALDIRVSQNRIRADFNYQKFHERPGLKRKRLKSQRWRRRFKEGFRATVAKVIRMRNMGW